jgi:hypothetical protein
MDWAVDDKVRCHKFCEILRVIVVCASVRVRKLEGAPRTLATTKEFRLGHLPGVGLKN